MAARCRFGAASALVAVVLALLGGVGAEPATAATVPAVAVVAAPAEVEPSSPSPGPEPPDGVAPEPSPEPSPGPEPSPPPAGGDGGQEEPAAPQDQRCGMFDYACKVGEAFTGWLASVVAELVNASLMVAAMGLMSTPPPSPGVEQAWSVSLAVTNALYLLLVTVAGVVVMTNQSVQTSTGLKEVLPRLLLGFVGANASWFLCELMADVGNAVSLSLLGDAASPDNVAAAIDRMMANPLGELLILALLYLVANTLQFFFFFAVLIRVMLWILLTAAAPLALAAHALPQTDGLAQLWWRAMGALLLIQVAQALTLRVAVTIFLSRESVDFVDPAGAAASLADVGVLICCVYVLVRIPFWAFKRVFNYQASPVLKAARFAISLLVFRNIGKALASSRAAKGTQKAASRAVAPPRSRPSALRPGPKPRWTQPELPLNYPSPRGKPQEPIPGIDSGIDPKAQRRLAERRRYVQAPLPGGVLGQHSRPAWWRQDPLPNAPTPRWRQGPIPHLRTAPRVRQDALFETPSQMRRAPSGRVPPARPRPTPPPREMPQRRPVRLTPRHNQYRSNRRRP